MVYPMIKLASLLMASLAASNAWAAYRPHDVVSPRSTGIRLATATVTSADCTDTPTGTVTISRQDGSWVSGATCNLVGQYALTFTAGTFSANPSCVATAHSGGSFVGLSGVTTAGLTLTIRSDTSARSNQTVSIMCSGPK